MPDNELIQLGLLLGVVLLPAIVGVMLPVNIRPLRRIRWKAEAWERYAAALTSEQLLQVYEAGDSEGEQLGDSMAGGRHKGSWRTRLRR